MKNTSDHTFHIPVMGLAFTIDTPIKVAKFGISSVVSIIEDHLIESMREVICKNENLKYVEISTRENDYRARRITAYLNTLNQIVNDQIKNIKQEAFESDEAINKYFNMLPDESITRKIYAEMLKSEGNEKLVLQNKLKQLISPGTIDVNIMTKLDKPNFDKLEHELPIEYADAHAALRGYANSKLKSSIIFSAGLNPRLYAYCGKFKDFFPNKSGIIKKKIVLKVSDFRSALIQGKFLAKKGLWVSEFRIESGINCGGHAFISNGVPLGPILEEFKNKRNELFAELYSDCSNALNLLKLNKLGIQPQFRITAQGGIGTAEENTFLLDYYNLDATGWGSPFLLVPEVTNVEDDTLKKLVQAKKTDYYLSHASPLGIPFNNFRATSSDRQRLARIDKKRPGSPCYKKFLASNTEFTERPICTASREYQNLKLNELKSRNLDANLLESAIEDIVQKDCLCEGLSASALLKNHAKLSHKLSAVAICPGPNLAYFSDIFSLNQMVDHIYGRKNILNALPRPNVFINELQLYIDYLKKEWAKKVLELSGKEHNYFVNFKENLLRGIDYYYSKVNIINTKSQSAYEQMITQLDEFKKTLHNFSIEDFVLKNSMVKQTK